MARPEGYGYTPEMHHWLAIHAPNNDRTDLTRRFNEHFKAHKSLRAIQAYCKRHGWKSSHNGHFKPGQPSWNHGKAGKGICKPNSGSFKKGTLPHNAKPIGSERVCAKSGFILIKVKLGKHSYRHKHRVIWEAANGPVPKGMVITFIDGNPLNCALENLEMISARENLTRNRLKLHQQPEQIKPSLKLIAKLDAKISEKGPRNDKKTNQKQPAKSARKQHKNKRHDVS